jgi:hypothetical protein
MITGIDTLIQIVAALQPLDGSLSQPKYGWWYSVGQSGLHLETKRQCDRVQRAQVC